MRYFSAISSIMLTETMVDSGESLRSFEIVGATLSQTMAIFAPWSWNWGRSSEAV